MDKVQVHMPDRLGHIPAGRVFVFAEVGHKWVYLRPSHLPNCHPKKIFRWQWDEIVAKTAANEQRGGEPVKKVSR